VDRRALEGMNKLQNLRVDLVEAVRTIQSYGIAVLGHMIIGSDTDDLSTFGLTATFVEDAQILHHFCHPLMAPPGTRLWYRLAREGRLVKPADGENDRFDIIPNIQTANMTRVELLEGLADYWEQVFSPEHYVKRALGFLDNITRKPAFLKPKGKEVGKTFRFLMGIIGFFMFKAEAVHRRAFFRILRKAGPMGPAVVQRAIFLYTCFMMDMKRAWHDAAMARQQAVRERANPGAMVPESGNIPLSQKVIEHVSAITGDAYASLRPRIAGREQLYRAVVEAMIEYSDRFGATLADYDDFQRDNLLQSCERVAGLRSGDAGDGMVMPDSPPAGFSREIMDSVDNALRVRQMA
jgi:hypothetical protein